MILVYSPHITPRIRYIFKLIINDLLKDEVVLTSDTDEVAAFQGPRINYSNDSTIKGLYFAAHGLLTEKEIENRDLSFTEEDGNVAFFKVYDKASAMSFDPFAASFYLVTRYEEYLPYVRDEYGRFQAKESIAFKHGFLDKPMVNIWAGMIADRISKRWRTWSPGHKKYTFIPTIDVNAAWKYKRKGFFRTAAGLAISIGKGEFRSVIERLQVITGRKGDPFDTYAQQLDLHTQYGLDTIYFILFADYDNNDRNIPVNNNPFKILIKSLADYYKIGIHTSFASLKSPEKMELEFSRLSSVLNKEINITRQHFHVLNMPVTYRNFVSRDVEEDYSMGYAVIPGFRAGICDPFLFYDLDFEMVTNLRVWPYSLVDKGLENGYGLESSFRPIIDSVKAVNGTLITLWNNESLVEKGPGKLNLRTYEKMIIMARP